MSAPEGTAAEGGAPPRAVEAPTPPLSVPPVAAEPPPGFRIPSLARRLTIGVLTGVALFFVLVILPTEALSRLAELSVGFTTQVPVGAIELSGTAIALLYAARPVVAPMRAYGPVYAAGALVSLGYLLYLAPLAWVALGMGEVGIALGFGGLLTLLAIVPLLSIGAGIVTTLEDFARPGERVRYQYRVAY